MSSRPPGAGQNGPDALSLAAGTRLGGYEVSTPLGAGGMGEVYRATDTKLGRDVALKLLPASFTGDADRVARFRREAQVLASLNHPHIAAIYGLEESSSTQFLVLELVDGESLDRRIARGRIPVDEALAIATQIAEALEAAHDKGIVHRDLKPANIALSRDGAVKVLDFGLAKPTEAPHGMQLDATPSPTMTTPALTGIGIILGTAAYMSPEQAKGRAADKRSDIWAFGCVLYEMLTGRRAFGGDDVTETITAVLRDQPDWAALPKETPAGVRRLLARCLERDPKARLRDIGDARLEIIDSSRSIVGSVVRTPSAPTASHAVWLLAGVLAAAAAITAVMRRDVDGPPPPVARVVVLPPADVPLRIDTDTPDVAIAGDGSRIIYVSRRSDPEGARIAATQLVSRQINAFEASALPNLGFSPRAPFGRPDGSSFAFATTLGASVTPVLASVPTIGAPLTVIDDLSGLGDLRGADWTADGRIVFATSQTTTGLLQIPAAGGTRVTLTRPDPARGEIDHVWPSALPGNAGTLFAIARGDRRFDVAVLPAGASVARVLVAGGTMPRYLSSGHLVYVADSVLYGVGFDLRTLKVRTDPVALVSGVMTKPSGAADFTVAANGTLAYVPGTYREPMRRMVWLHGDGTSSALPLDAGQYDDARLSPDGRRVAVTVQERAVSSIWIYDTARDTFTRVTPPDESVRSPVWSRDGRRLAFWSQAQRGLFTIAVDGSERSERLATSETGTLFPSAWSPDGGMIAFVQDRPSLTLLAVSTRPPHAVHPLAAGAGAQVEGTFSPDGRWLAHIATGRDGGDPEVVVGPSSGGRQWPIAPTGRYPTWSVDGRNVIYVDRGALYRVPIEGATGMPLGRPAKVLDLPASIAGIRPVDSSPDGRFLVLERVQNDDRPAEIRVVLNWFDELRSRLPTK